MNRILIAFATTLLLIGCVTTDPATLSNRYTVEVYNTDKVYGGTTIFGDTSDPRNPMLVEVDLAGKVVWSYELPESLRDQGRAGGGMDVEWVPKSDTILIGIRNSGIYEINRDGKVVWSFPYDAVSHDVDRLPNGNTLAVWGWGEDSSDPEAFEIDKSGNFVWQWHAEPHLKNYKRHLNKEGFTHANAVVRLRNGNTLVSLRNFYMLVEVDRAGNIVWKLENLFTTPHDPEELPNGNILVNTRRPQVLREFDRSGRVVWEHYPRNANRIRYNHQLPNGNIIFVDRRDIVEITSAGEVVWRLRLKDVDIGSADKNRHFYKAERIPMRSGASLPIPPSTARHSEPKGTSAPLTRAGAMASRMIEKFDNNGDGQLTESEYQGRRIPFKRLDNNGDGIATASEIEIAVERRMRRKTRRDK